MDILFRAVMTFQVPVTYLQEWRDIDEEKFILQKEEIG